MARTKEQSEKAVAQAGLRLDFSKSPVIYDFIQSNAFVQGIMGPVGSGKSYGCASKIFIKAVQQKPSPIDNIRYTRTLASPVALLVGGAPWLLPLLAVNAGLDTVDHLEASDLSVYCGGPEKPNGQIAREVMMGVGFGLGLSK